VAGRQAHQIYSDRDIYPLFGWRRDRPAAIVQLAARNVHSSVANPVQGLGVVCSRKNRLFLRIRASTVYPNISGHAGPLTSARDQIRDLDGVGHAPMQFASTVEQVPADKMDILEI
jgi:hypothetical protein